MSEHRGDLEIDIDDFGLRDEDFLGSQTTKEQQPGPAAADTNENDNDDVMEIEPVPEAAKDNSVLGIVRPEAIHIEGVDDMSTADVQQFVKNYLGKEFFKIEWINDTSLNVVFRIPEKAEQALTALTPEDLPVPMELTTSRGTKEVPGKPDTKLSVRMAIDSDKKERNARSKSKYYLMHGEPSFQDERYRVHDPNMNAGPQEQTEQTVAQEYRFRPVATEEDELFPEKLTGGAVNRFRERSPVRNKNKRNRRRGGDLFHDRLDKRPKVGLAAENTRDRSRSPGARGRSERGNGDDDEDLFPSKGEGRQKDLANRISKPNRSRGDDERWVKGDKLSDRLSKPNQERAGRHQAADLF